MVPSKHIGPRILLASRSPQRLALLSQIIAPNRIEVRASQHPEDHLPGEMPEQRVVRLAREKARVILEKAEFTDDIAIIVAADTEVVIYDSRGNPDIVAHPSRPDEAIAALRQLAGKEHVVITGIALVGVDPDGQGMHRKVVSEAVSTSVKFKPLTEAEILNYVDTGECFGRAGAYAIQGKGVVLVETIRGSYSNVVGLPLERLAEILDKEFDLPIWDLDPASNWKKPRLLKYSKD